jgi:predicted acyltransferase
MTSVAHDAAEPRLRSLDALRGFDMMWIIGSREILTALSQSNDSAALRWLSAQTEHAEWNGFTFWDLIFPLFLFLAGVSTPFSFAKRLEHGDSRARIAAHAVRRGLTLVLLGLVYNGLLAFDWEHLRYPSVLGRIGLAWMFAALITLVTTTRGRIAWIVALLLGYWAALMWIPVPEFGAGNLEPGATLTDWVDRTLLPGRLYRVVRDPEGILSTVPAIATALFGVLAGEWLRAPKKSGLANAAGLAGAGLALLALGKLWSLSLPLNKNLWTSSFVLWTAGWSALALAAFYYVIDVLGFVRWSFVFVVIGVNAITIYMAERFVDFAAIAAIVFGPQKQHIHPALFAALPLAIEWVLLYVLYKKRLFLRI